MQIVFRGGPWDGCEMKTSYLPNQLVLRALKFGGNDKPAENDFSFGDIDLSFSENDLNTYTLRGRRIVSGVTLSVGVNMEREPEEGDDICDLVSEEVLEAVYDHTPSVKGWFDTLGPQ